MASLPEKLVTKVMKACEKFDAAYDKVEAVYTNPDAQIEELTQTVAAQIILSGQRQANFTVAKPTTSTDISWPVKSSFASRKTRSEPSKLPSTARYHRLMEAKGPYTGGVDSGHWVVENGIWLWTEGGVREPKAQDDLDRQDSFLAHDKKLPESSLFNTIALEHLNAGEAIDELEKAFRPTTEKWSIDEDTEDEDEAGDTAYD